LSAENAVTPVDTTCRNRSIPRPSAAEVNKISYPSCVYSPTTHWKSATSIKSDLFNTITGRTPPRSAAIK